MTRLVKAPELSAYLNLKVKTIYEMVRRGEIPHVKFGRLVRFSLEDIDEWIEENRTRVVEEVKPEPKPKQITARDPEIRRLAQEFLARDAGSSEHEGKSGRVGTLKGESR